eukprot:6213547-Pleurochrysis_carterae.AAC.1
MEPGAGPVPTLVRMTAEQRYGDAVWAAVYSNGKYTGTLAAEGCGPHCPCIEDAVGPDRPPEVREELRGLVEAVLALDLEVEAAVKPLGGRRPLARAQADC